MLKDEHIDGFNDENRRECIKTHFNPERFMLRVRVFKYWFMLKLVFSLARATG
ncbi:hypothetical protein VISI1226_15206 [Vibrio sinaloensis DSM 21326]|uniref:Uncharacterized protein n=1 Tax=Vibrio sinaloensis DSM 21326 TaxID=945550 RepID=E8MCS4_PHOS4|nr:hypothetical protein VISI1226_15206 [Vibrio sinaloensis DSM 21326]